MVLIDTHCHLYVSDFESDIGPILERATAEGITQMYLPAIDSSELDRLLALEKAYPGRCIAMMGLHPCSIKENFEEELKIVSDQLAARKFAAIGETGLDFYWDLSFVEQQYEGFRRQVRWAAELGLPIVIHSRNSLDECIGVIRENQDGKLNGIFHCFSGTLDQARQIMDLGFYMGIGGVLTYKNSGLAEVVRQLPLESLVLETDAPYLTPVPFRGRRNEPARVIEVARCLADIRGVGLDEIGFATSRNFATIFGLDLI